MHAFLFGSRQCLPIEQRAGRAQIVSLCLHQSEIWQLFVQTIQLRENMRAETLLRTASDEAERARIREWVLFLLQVGNGEGVVASEDGTEDMQLPAEICRSVADETDVLSMIAWTYGDNPFENDWRFWAKRAIVTPRHVCADYVNDLMLSRSPEPEIVCLSADVITNDGASELSIPEELLNKQDYGSLPAHRLRLKRGAVVMLLRNLDPSRGLSNGVRMIVLQVVQNRYLRCKIIAGSRAGDEVLIPRIKLMPPKGRLPVSWYRLQFPVKVSYCMTGESAP